MSKRLVGFIALFSLALSASPAGWSLNCAEVEALLNQGLSRADIEARIQADGGDTSIIDQCIASIQKRAQREAAAKVKASVQQAPASEPAPMADSPDPVIQFGRDKPIDGASSGASRRPTPRPSPRPVSATPSAPPPPPISWNAPPHVEQPIGSEDYQDYGVNEMVLAEKDNQSTFSVDVDTASYAISRRKLREGGMPPAASVRVEEFVNAFDYGYSAPTDGRPFAVHLEATANPETPNRQILRVGVQGRALQGERKPVHLTFLADVSGSMNSPDKLGLAKQALHTLVDNLGPEDTVALATYAGSERIVLEPTYTTRKAQIHEAIDNLSSGGGTAMGSGMELAYRMASESYLHGAENRVIVLSDGDANIGRTSHDEILRTVEHYAEEGITLTTVGFGMGNYKDTMMEQLANKGDGNYFYLDSYKEAAKVFGEDLSGTIQTIAKDVKIQVEFDPDAVHAYRLIGYENRDIADRDFRNDQVDAGEVGSGHQVTAVYDVILKDDAAKKETIATVRMRAKKPGPDSAAKEYTWSVPVSAIVADFGEASRDSRSAWAVATFAEKLRGSPFAEEISYKQIYRYASEASDDSDDHRELLELIAKAAQLSGEGSPVAAR
ncbi:MAG: von Willebrand factor type A domain-containing protein [Myxococcota bacterium]